MNRHIFISHAKSDKPRIKPVLDVLLSAGFTLWIDEPRKVGLQGHDRVLGVPLESDNFSASIQAALDQAGAVVALWSFDALRPERRIMHAEARSALTDRKLIQLAIDPILDGNHKFPLGFSEGQITDISRELVRRDRPPDLADVVRALHMSLRRTREHAVSAAALAGPALEFREQLAQGGVAGYLQNQFSETSGAEPIAYLVDRARQRAEFVMQLCAELAAGPGARPVVFVLPGPREEAPEMFLESLKHEALAQIQQTGNLGPQFDWTERKLKWPSCGQRLRQEEPDAAFAGCLCALSDALHVGEARLAEQPEAFAHHVARRLVDEPNQAILLYARIEPDVWGSEDERLIESFIGWLGKLPLHNVRTRPVVLLKLVGATTGRRRALGLLRSRPPVARFCERLDPNRFPGVRLVKLNPLDSITTGDLSDWVDVFRRKRAASVPHADIVARAAPRLLERDERKPLGWVGPQLERVVREIEYARKLCEG